MDPMTIFALSAGVLSTLMVYVAMKVSHFGASQALTDKLLKLETDLAAAKKTLQGYTHYATCLDASRQGAAELLKAPVLKITREYTQVETLAKEQHALKADATLIVKYAVEFGFAMDVSPAGLVLAELANGVSLRISRPTLLGEPRIMTLSSQVISSFDLPDKALTLAEAYTRFVPLARVFGANLRTEEAVLNLCKLKAMEATRDALASQPGVRHVPAIFCEQK
jgi:hypothetical protein